MKEQQPKNLKRRGLLLADGVGSAGEVAEVAVGAGRQEEPEAVDDSEEKTGGGYGENSKVRN